MSEPPCIWKTENLSAGYGDEDVLSGVSISVQEGMVLVIIGQNGSGKSTFLRTLSGMLERRQGEIWLHQQKQLRIEPHRLARKGVSFFIQGSLVIPELTVAEHLRLAGMQGGKKPWETNLDLVLKEFPQLKDLLLQRAGNLSGGERQVLSFAILLLQQTRCWLLDEPTAGLSPDLVGQTTAYLARKSREGITMLLVEHNMDVAFALATHIVIAKGGCLTRMFPRTEFLRKDFLEEHLYS